MLTAAGVVDRVLASALGVSPIPVEDGDLASPAPLPGILGEVGSPPSAGWLFGVDPPRAMSG